MKIAVAFHSICSADRLTVFNQVAARQNLAHQVFQSEAINHSFNADCTLNW